MADFSREILREIRQYSLSRREKEVCGAIFQYDRQHFFPLKNGSSSANSFALTPEIYLLKDKVSAIVHSHPYSDAYPSPADVASSQNSGLPFLIYSCLYNNFLYFDCMRCNPVKE